MAGVQASPDSTGGTGSRRLTPAGSEERLGHMALSLSNSNAASQIDSLLSKNRKSRSNHAPAEVWVWFRSLAQSFCNNQNKSLCVPVRVR